MDLSTPFDIINLPSGGFFYPNKKSSVMVKYLTAKEEVILTSPAIMENGQALDIVLKSVILDNDINTNNLLIGDKNAILIFLRSTSYGDNLPVSIVCSECGKSGETSFALSNLNIKEIKERPDDNGEYSFTLSKMKSEKLPINIKFKPMTVESERIMLNEFDANIEISKKNITSKYKHQISSINGNSDKNYIEKVIKHMPISDSMQLRNYIDAVEPGFDKNIKFQCPVCSYEFTDEFTIGNNFFGLTPQYRTNVMEEIFLAYYYGKGITREDAYNMTVSERKWTINRITEEIEKKNKAEEQAMNKAKAKK